MGDGLSYVSGGVAKDIFAAQKCNHLVSKKLSVSRLDGIVAVSGWGRAGLYCEAGLIRTSKIYRECPEGNLFSWGNEVPDEITDPVFYLGVWHVCWGHCLTDQLKFLWPIIRPGGLGELSGCKFMAVMMDPGQKEVENFSALLGCFGIDSRSVIVVSGVCRVRTCYLADECFWCESVLLKNVSPVVAAANARRYFTCEYMDVVESVCHRLNEQMPAAYREKCPTKVYLTRTGWHGWDFGERRVEEAFEKAGFSIVHPERLSLGELVVLLNNADVVAACEGSCAHNSVFMRKGAKLIILRKHNFINQYQMAINQARKLDVVYVDANASFIFYHGNWHNGGPFFIYVSKNLARLLGVSPEFPIGEFVRYVVWSSYMKYGHLVCEYLRRMRRMLKSCGNVYPRRRLSLRRSGI